MLIIQFLKLRQIVKNSLDSLLADGQSGTFTQEWEQHLFSQRKQSDGFSEFVSDRAGSSSRFLPSQLFDLESGIGLNGHVSAISKALSDQV